MVNPAHNIVQLFFEFQPGMTVNLSRLLVISKKSYSYLGISAGGMEDDFS
jgi:hypothetical protein